MSQSPPSAASGSGRAAIGTLILAISTAQLANGFFGTLFSLRVAAEAFGAAADGVVLSAYFVGYTIGALRCGRIVARVGHIRAFAAFAGLVAGATVLVPVAVAPLPWLLLRAVVGFGAAGLFLTTESWLNAKAAPAERGRVFSLYMVGTFAALALGQLLIGKADVTAFRPFNLIAALFAAALLLVTTTRAEPPALEASEPLPWRRLTGRAPLAVLGCGVAGLLGGAFYALVPAWMRGEGIAQSTIALFMFAAVMGGLAFQVPVGRLSDRLDRRRVMVLVAAGFAAGAIAIVQMPPRLAAVLPVAVVLGGFMSTLYPVCVAHAHDWMPADQVVEVSGRLIFVNGVGSSLGPLLGALVMGAFGIDGLFYFMAGVVLLFGATVLARSTRVDEPAHHARPFDVLAPQAAPLGHAYREPEGEAAGS